MTPERLAEIERWLTTPPNASVDWGMCHVDDCGKAATSMVNLGAYRHWSSPLEMVPACEDHGGAPLGGWLLFRREGVKEVCDALRAAWAELDRVVVHGR